MENNIMPVTNDTPAQGIGSGETTSGAVASPTVVAPATGAPATTPVAAPSTAQDGAANSEQHFGQKVLHSILGALGGTETVAYDRDPQTGKMIVSREKSGPGQQWKRIIAGALTGMAAGAQAGPGPGHIGKAAGAGFNAGMELVKGQDDQAYKRANDDFDAQQTAMVRKAQTALLNQQVSELAFKNGRNKVTAAFDDAARENAFSSMIQSGGTGSTDLGVARNIDEVMSLHKNMPNLLQEQAHGNIIGVPHISETGEVDGMHYALVTPEWKNAKLDADQPFYRLVPPTKPGQKPTVKMEMIKAGTMTNGEYMANSMASEKGIQTWYEKQAELTSEEKRSQLAADTQIKTTAMREAGEDRRTAATLAAQKDLYGIKASTKDIADIDKNYVKPARDVEKSWMMMDSAYNEYMAAKKQGKDLPSGAQSMLALSTHLSTTFGNVKGSRITKDMIQHHMGARSISDEVTVAIQRLTNGDGLSPAQWEAFHNLIKESRMLSWKNAVDESKRKKTPIDYLPDDLQGLAAPPNAESEVYAADGKTVIGHIVNGKYVALGEGK